MKHNVSYRHYKFYRFLLQNDLIFERVDHEIIIRQNNKTIAYLTFEETGFMRARFIDGRTSLLIMYETYHRVLLMRKYV